MEHEADPAVGGPVADEVELTGVDQVDRVLTDVAGLAGMPVAEHVAAFERAHEQLRRALDATSPAGAPGTADERGA